MQALCLARTALMKTPAQGACIVLRPGYPAASFNSVGPLLKDNSIRLAPLQTSQTSRNFTHAPGAPRSASTGTWLGSAGSDRRVSTYKDSRTPPESFHDCPVMALHIRDFRQTDAAGLSRLATAAHQLGDLPEFTPDGRILVGLREDRLAAAIWFKLEGQTGIVDAIALTSSGHWRSDVQELIAEASLWLTSRGAVRIELMTLPEDSALLTGLRDMHFKADESARAMTRLVPARSAA